MKKKPEVKEKSSLEKLLEKMPIVEVAYRTQISTATLYRWKQGKGKPNAALARLLDQAVAESEGKISWVIPDIGK